MGGRAVTGPFIVGCGKPDVAVDLHRLDDFSDFGNLLRRRSTKALYYDEYDEFKYSCDFFHRLFGPYSTNLRRLSKS
jgi:hypothetical protein